MSGAEPCLIMLADDYAPFRQYVRTILEEAPLLKVVGEAGDGLELLNLLRSSRSPQLVILDIKMPNLSGIEATREINKVYPGIKVLILTLHKEREFLHQAISAGAQGYLLKEDAESEIFTAIERIQKGEIYLSPFFQSPSADFSQR